MKTNILRSFAVAVGLSVCVAGTSQDVQAESNDYQAPSQWNTFNLQSPASPLRQVGHGEVISSGSTLPVPAPAVSHSAPLASHGTAVGSGCNSCQGGTSYSSPYANAVSSDWSGNCNGGYASGGYGKSSHGIGSRLGNAFGSGQRAPGGLYPWFGGASLLFMTLENNSSRTLLVDDATGTDQLNTTAVAPDTTTGFDVHFGRYLGCGQYGLDIGYFNLDPSEQSVTVIPGAPGDYRAAMPAWNAVSINPGGLGIDTLYNYFDNAPAAGYRVRRDMRFQGLEANLVSFGLMGNRRVGSPACGKFVPDGYRFAGPNGSIARACSNRVQVTTSHGFRWFQLEDAFEYAVNIDGTLGYQAEDIYYNVDTENNLFGYQFGSRLSYCLTNRLNLGIGGKVGIYGNDVEMRQRIGTDTTLAYITTAGVDDVDTTASDTVMSALAELDLGLGYRLNSAWSIRGGYRMLAACGVATAPGSIVNDYSSLAPSQVVNADDCIMLHGGYVGLEFNW
tara:strand:+ start:113535 stop:115046 length:1512 start_codon:yes stop_codon:yes gene_type:complete